MRTRLIIHYIDGKTFTGDWDVTYCFRNLNERPISSLQIQQSNGVNHTLSSKKKQLNAFWQRDEIIDFKIVTRSIFRRLSNNIWLVLSVQCDSCKRKISIIKEDIGAQNAK